VSNFGKSATLPPPSAHVLVGAPRAVFVTLTIHLRGAKSESDKAQERFCLDNAHTETDRDACTE